MALLAPSSSAQVGTVRAVQKISETTGGFEGELDPADMFGVSVASLGDLDGDGVTDLAVGAYLDHDGGYRQGAVWILFLDAKGKVKSQQKISETAGGFGGDLDPCDAFGASVGRLGDLNGDGLPELAVGAIGDGDGGYRKGALWILSLNSDGTVNSEQKISEQAGGFGGVLYPRTYFGTSPSPLGDLDEDGVTELAVGAPGDNENPISQGAVWILFLNADGTVKSEQKINETSGGFGGVLSDIGAFGYAVASLGDLDGDGVTDLAVGAYNDHESGVSRGAVWILFLNVDGTVKSEQKIGPIDGGFGGTLDPGAYFGVSACSIGDMDRDGITDLAVGADIYSANSGGTVWLLFLNANGTVKREQRITGTVRGFNGTLDLRDSFGSSLSNLGDFNRDGITDIVAGAFRDDDGGTDAGAVWVVFLGQRATPPN